MGGVETKVDAIFVNCVSPFLRYDMYTICVTFGYKLHKEDAHMACTLSLPNKH